MNSTPNFGDRLNDLMLEKNISNRQLAERIGVHVTTVQRWKRNSKLLCLSPLVKLADFFRCPIDFLAGRTDGYTETDYPPCPPFYIRFRAVLREKKITRYQMDKATKIKDSYFTEWSRGSDPHLVSLIEIADYLDITIDYLVGRE